MQCPGPRPGAASSSRREAEAGQYVEDILPRITVGPAVLVHQFMSPLDAGGARASRSGGRWCGPDDSQRGRQVRVVPTATAGSAADAQYKPAGAAPSRCGLGGALDDPEPGDRVEVFTGRCWGPESERRPRRRPGRESAHARLEHPEPLPRGAIGTPRTGVGSGPRTADSFTTEFSVVVESR